MKQIKKLYDILLITSILLFIISIFLNSYSFSYSMILIFILLLAILTFVTGTIINKRQFYKKNITKYIILYFILLLSLTMFINRPRISFFSFKLLNSINIIPFKSIIRYLVGPININIKVMNILGNAVAFIPFSFLLILKDKKYYKLKNQFIYLGIVVLTIETLQLITSTGRFDIDDFILNIGGSLLFVFLLKKTKQIDQLKKIFYQDFNIPKLVRIIIWIIAFIFIVLVDIIMLVKMLTIKQELIQTFYVAEKSSCVNLEKIEMNGYNLYLNCVDVIYETDDFYQLPIQDALENKKLTRNKIKEKLTKKEVLWDGGTAIYVNPDENIAIILCQTLDGNKDIYVGNKNMRYNDNFCKNDDKS